MQTSRAVLILASVFLLSCQHKKDDAPAPAAPAVPAVQPAPAPITHEEPQKVSPPPKILDAGVDFVTWNDDVDDDAFNPVVFQNDGPQQMRIHYAFRPNVQKYLRVLQVKPIVTCVEGEISEPKVYLIHGAERQDLTFSESIQVDAGEDYVVEVVQDLKCAKASGLYEAVIWTGLNDQIEPVLVNTCKAAGQEQAFNFFPAVTPVAYLGQSQKYLSGQNYCGRAVDESQAKCSVQRQGAHETYVCETTTRPEKSTFTVVLDAIQKVGTVQCDTNGVAGEPMALESCQVKVLDRNDFR